ncbi:hypothetical protein CCACVL1_29621 [Corchorus capsularis]|uniref:Uncharacterized protein n=1 Tax=Corchorus capsularis TaxID=210143 RepID=A0A1R3G0X4_COCAP|nr:hypothetical protein CCACVL1_29621 [Corchorus capsularis]
MTCPFAVLAVEDGSTIFYAEQIIEEALGSTTISAEAI